MELSISPVETEDVDLLVRRVEFPAHQDNPLYRLMFPRSTEEHWEQREDEIRWTIDGILETVYQEDEALYKACGEDGSPVGLIGWTTSPGAFAKGMSRDCTYGGPVVKSGAREVGKVKIRNSFTPPSLDVTSWLGISKRLREERQRVIQGYPGNGICRITFMAVDPNFQRRGVGSTLMKIFCDYVDDNALDAFVLSSPALKPSLSATIQGTSKSEKTWSREAKSFGIWPAHTLGTAKALKVNINSRVAVDAAFFHEMQPNYSRPSLRDLGARDKNGIAVFDLGAMLMEDRERQKERMQGDGMEAQKLCEANFLVACPTVCCFSFKEKMFLECAVSALVNVDWSSESFDCLQIPSETKTLLLSMAKTRLGLIPTVPFDDVIDGKGQGLNILLDGPPGVGKTFTVEATSEYFKLPLYSISAGELVVDHGDSNALERQLETIFKIAKHFKAVLLLDEADAFMEQRTAYHGTHNRLVTVFLRKLEYYQGILFLTSNRGIQSDDAILSRIHLIIKYKDLSREFRKGLWSTFLTRARTVQGPAMIEEHDLRRLESLALNGREIKNIAAVAHALAEADANQVNYKYLELAAESNQKFSKEFGRQEMYI